MLGESKKRLELVLKAGSFVFALIIAAKILNFIKKILIGNLFGISWQADSFFAASYLPYYMAVFFEGLIYLGFIPLFSKVLAEEGMEEAKNRIGDILPWIILVAAILVFGACWGAPWLIREIAPGFKPEAQLLTESLFRIVSLVIIFITLSSFFQSLNSFFGNYVAAASSGLTDSVVMIVLTIALSPAGGIYAAAWGAVAGAFTSFAYEFFLLNRSQKILPLKIRVNRRSFFWFLNMLVPLGIIWVFQMGPIFILNRFGSGMWQGTISAMTIALGIMVVPTGLVSQTILISIFPFLAKEAHDTETNNVQETFFQTLRAAFFILIPVGFLLSGLSRPIALLFFGHDGEVTEGVRRISNSLFYLGWSAFVFYADLFMTQSLITIRKIPPAILLCITRAAITYGFCYFLSGLLDYRGVALSFSLGLAINFFILFPVCFRLTPLHGKWKELFTYCLKLVLAAGLLLTGPWILAAPFFKTAETVAAKWTLLGQMACFSAAGLLIYFFVLHGLKVKELHSVFCTLKKIRTQKKWWITDTSDV